MQAFSATRITGRRTWPLARAEQVVVELRGLSSQSSFCHTKQAIVDDVGSDIYCESLNGHVPGLFVTINKCGLDGILEEDLEIRVAISFAGIDSPVCYRGDWNGSRTSWNLPIALLDAEGNVCSSVFKQLRFVVDLDRDLFILNDADRADISDVVSGCIPEQVLLRAMVEDITGLNLDEPFVIKLQLVGDVRYTRVLHTTSPKGGYDEEFIFLLPLTLPLNESQRSGDLLQLQVYDLKENQVAEGAIPLSTFEPVIENTLDIALEPHGSVRMILELTALLDPWKVSEGAYEVCLQPKPMLCALISTHLVVVGHDVSYDELFSSL